VLARGLGILKPGNDHQVFGRGAIGEVIKEALRRVGSRLIVHSRFSRLSRRMIAKPGTLIVYGHRVAADSDGYMEGLTPAFFEQQMHYLTRHYEVLALSRLVEILACGKNPPNNSVVLTFDDGFVDNLDNAFPILERFGAPATIFLVTGSIASGQLPWSQRLGYLFQRSDQSQLPALVSGIGDLPLGSAGDRRRAYFLVKQQLRALGREQRERRLDELARALAVNGPVDRMLSWDQVRAMQAVGIEFGAHTYSHPLLAEIEHEEAVWEMRKSRDDLAENLGIERPAFCFPAGSYNQQLLRTVQELGFSSCFLPDRPVRYNNIDNADPFTLSRTGLPNAPAWVLEAELDGPFHLIRRVLGRAA